MSEDLLNKIGEYYVNSGVNLSELANIFKMDILKITRYFTKREYLKLRPDIQERVDNKKKTEDNILLNLLKIALKFRLSLKNVCRLDGIEKPTDMDALNMWYRVRAVTYDKLINIDPYKYLFNYESANNPEKYEFSSLYEARMFIGKLKKEQDPIKRKKIIDELSKEEDDFISFKKFFHPGKVVSIGDINIIENYRIRHVLKQSDMAELLHVDKHTFQRWESQLTDERLKYRVGQLNSYQIALHEQLEKKR